MSLEKLSETVEAEKQKPTATAKTLTEQAREAVAKHLDLPMPAARDKVAEEVNCSKSTAYKAYKWAKKQQKKTVKKQEKAPELSVIDTPDQTPEYLEKPTEKAIEPEVVTPSEQAELAPEAQEQLDLFRDMLRGLYEMAFSTDGIAGKYGRKPEQCKKLADQQYLWLERRVTPEQLANFDTFILGGSYIIVIGGIMKDYLADRAKRKKQEEGEKT